MGTYEVQIPTLLKIDRLEVPVAQGPGYLRWSEGMPLEIGRVHSRADPAPKPRGPPHRPKARACHRTVDRTVAPIAVEFAQPRIDRRSAGITTGLPDPSYEAVACHLPAG